MRYYIQAPSSLYNIDLQLIQKIDAQNFEFQLVYQQKDKALNANNKKLEIKKLTIYVKLMSHGKFYSYDKRHWKKLTSLKIPHSRSFHFCEGAGNFTMHRGFLASSSHEGSTGGLFTKIPGKVIKILVQPGEQVKKDQVLLVLEAMKMENEIKSQKDGVVKSVFVQEGQALEQGVQLLELDDH
jgi:biotin carboxyl carrier protein